MMIKDLAAALGTKERGPALVEVARNAGRAEQALAALVRKFDLVLDEWR